MTFVKSFDEEVDRVPWIDDPTARALFGAIAADHDAGVRELKDGVLIREPLLASADALWHLGNDRLLPRAPVQTDLEYAAWLDRAADMWEVAGTNEGYINVFTPYRFTADTVTVLSNHEVTGYWDGNADAFSRVFIFLDSREGHFLDDGVWADDPGDPQDVWSEDTSPAAATWDSNATKGDIAFFRKLIFLWKGDGAYPTSIAVWLPNNPDGYWDSPGGVWSDSTTDVWTEDDPNLVLYWTLGNVWGQEQWLAPGTVDLWEEGSEPMVDLPEEDAWVAFPNEE